MLNPQNLQPGEEQYETFKAGYHNRLYYQYDYRAEDGELFSCVAKKLEAARARRDKWLKAKKQ